MKTIKKTAAFLLAFALAFTLVGCSSGEIDDLLSNTKTPKSVIKAYYKSIQKTDEETYIEYLPEYKKVAYTYDDINLEDAVEETLKNELDNFEDEYGDDIKIKLDDIIVEETSDDYLIAVRIAQEFFQVDDVEISDATKVKFDITVKGDDGYAEGRGEAFLYKENGKWKVSKTAVEF